MTPQQAVSRKYDARIRRAEQLISKKSSATEVLFFYKKIAQFQKDLLAAIANRDSAGSKRTCSSLRETPDLATLLPHFGGFLSVAKQHAPAALAEAASNLVDAASEEWIAQLLSRWNTGGRSDDESEPITQFFPRAFLQPYAEYLAECTAAPPALSTPRACPLCDGRPLLGVLRLEGDGGKRYMVCSFCGYEWEFRRLLCPACGEEDEKKLPVYVAEQLPHIRVEACDTCKTFVRAIDLTKDGHAVPCVDDIAAIPLTLWAHEHGYRRLQTNLLGS